MIHNPLIHYRQSIRLKEYNYSQPGEYFVTICTYEKKCVFGKIIEEKNNIIAPWRNSEEMLGRNP